jgi:hypothetical protein
MDSNFAQPCPAETIHGRQVGLFTERRRTPSWCRSARFSNWSVALDLRVDDAAASNT